jgi:DNA-binding HxlR family transcriptional regulator
MATKKTPSFSCGLDAALAVIGAKWKPLVLYHLAKDTLRYGELMRAVGAVTHKVLIQQLKELEADGIVRRVDHREIPPRVDYSLTKLGQTLAGALAPLCQWGTDHVREIERVIARRAA